jgi:hypothetical protein
MSAVIHVGPLPDGDPLRHYRSDGVEWVQTGPLLSCEFHVRTEEDAARLRERLPREHDEWRALGGPVPVEDPAVFRRKRRATAETPEDALARMRSLRHGR